MNHTIINNIQLFEKVGHGHFGTVYRAIVPAIGDVAVKVFERKPNESEDQWNERRRLLVREGEKLKAAEHPHVVKVYQVGETDDNAKAFLVMEYCTNGSLSRYISQNPLVTSQVYKTIWETLLGLESIHAQGIIHQDIKPNNVLIDAQGRIKLGDFGLVPSLNVHGFFAALQIYRLNAPLEAQEDFIVDSKTDIWALGMMAYRLLNGDAWFEHYIKPKYSNLLKRGKLADSLKWLPHVPSQWRKLVAKMLHVNSDKRFQNCVDVRTTMLKLPLFSDWECDYTLGKIVWTRNVHDRRWQAIYEQKSRDQFTCTVQSHPANPARGKRAITILKNTSSTQDDAFTKMHQYFQSTYK